MEADIYELGRTSIKIEINVWIRRGTDKKDWIEICKAHTTFVALKDGKTYPHRKNMENIT